MGIRSPGKERGKIGATSPKKEVNHELEPPVFSFRYLQRGYCIQDCEAKEKAALADKLRQLSQLTWQELRNAPRHGQGYEKIAHSAIKAPIPRSAKEDTTLVAFRFCAKAPMVGYKEGAVFYVLWLDSKFKLYNH